MAIKTDPVRTIPTKRSTAAEWMQWHKSLRQNFGKKQANILWTKAWSLRGSEPANTIELREYLKKNDIHIGDSWDRIIDAGADVSDFFGDIWKIGKWTGIALTVIIVGGVGMIVYNIARKPVESAKTAVALRGMKGVK